MANLKNELNFWIRKRIVCSLYHKTLTIAIAVKSNT